MKYKTELVKAQEELEQMFVKVDELETRIAKQKRKVAALKEWSDGSEDSGPFLGMVTGITDACRTVLRSAEKPLLMTEIKGRVEKLGIPEQKNLLASVHTVVKRLIVNEDVLEAPPETGGDTPMRYRWASLGYRLRLAEQKSV
jgi:hypothetical protein